VLIGAAFLVDIHLGVVTALAVAAHEIPQEVGDFAVLLHSGFSRRKALLYNVLSSFTTLIGALGAWWSLAGIQWVLPYVLAVAASSFIYIAVADLIPGLHRKVHLSATLLIMTAKPKWYMLTLVGKDRPGIVAHITAALYEGGANLGEAAMMRLGGNFTIMLMVQFAGTRHALEQAIATETESLGLTAHIDPIEARLHDHREPDVRITVYGADRAGIVAKVTGVLAEAGLDILSALEIVRAEGVEATLEPVETLVG